MSLVSIQLTRRLAVVIGLLLCLLNGPTAGSFVLCIGTDNHVAIEGTGSECYRLDRSESALTSSAPQCSDIALLNDGSVAGQQHLVSPPSNTLIAILWPMLPTREAPASTPARAEVPPDPRMVVHQSVVLLI